MGVGNLHIRVSYLVTGARGVPCFVMNECGKFPHKGFSFSNRGKRGSMFRDEWVWEIST